VAVAVDYRAFLHRVTSPQHENQTFTVIVQLDYHAIRETFPTLALVCAGATPFNSQHRIQQQDSLLRPGLQVSATGLLTPQVVGNFAEYVAQ